MSAKQAELIASEEQEQDLEGEELDSEEVGDLVETEKPLRGLGYITKQTKTSWEGIMGDGYAFYQVYSEGTFSARVTGTLVWIRAVTTLGEKFDIYKEDSRHGQVKFGSMESAIYYLKDNLWNRDTLIDLLEKAVGKQPKPNRVAEVIDLFSAE